MPLQNIGDLCLPNRIPDSNLCLTFPGGVEVCAQFPSLVPPSPDELVKQLFAQFNSALAPLQPIFSIIDSINAIFGCIQAISTLNPEEIINCLPNLAEKIGALLKLVPVLSLPILVVQFIDILIVYLQGVQGQLEAMLDYNQAIANAAQLALLPGNAGLFELIECAETDRAAQIQWINNGTQPINSIIGLINNILISIGLGDYTISSLGEIDPLALDTAIAAINGTVAFLQALRSAIPLP